MFSKEESRQLREAFWTSFGKSFPRKWTLYNTKIKGLSFKFHFDTKKALVALDIDANLEQRIELWENLSALKSILTRDYLPDAVYSEDYVLDNGKIISRIYVILPSKVSIHNKDSWQEVMVFFNTTMSLFEDFFDEYKHIIKP
ncbi:MAG: DUF4268 domain-containing protein [Winogradskyella sp.]|nr:DUF4268 domain-containing protein [Winogradskyella sp.]MBT8376693.1 DUF4268 domain-containing protein [Bacteroidia bacterium]NNC46170.1 DUF4268 domain-containing protein [Winogradskyella sp.]NNF86849.1 DUF4268 domain-containing protein [Winogradskyella sp.]